MNKSWIAVAAIATVGGSAKRKGMERRRKGCRGWVHFHCMYSTPYYLLYMAWMALRVADGGCACGHHVEVQKQWKLRGRRTRQGSGRRPCDAMRCDATHDSGGQSSAGWCPARTITR
ncbi:hypothetical protein LZ31DRAFT_58126 [Colletotrichum somersetense]|nr:hypothetical protein LZ31DRAFT_58126 [Colletotrichum somersetense]